jgi:hypothetical protein
MFLLYQAQLLKHLEKTVLVWLEVAIVLGRKTRQKHTQLTF